MLNLLRNATVLASLFALTAACSSSSSSSSSSGGASDSGAKDSGGTIDAGASTCGNPGDTGNAIGIGKYCNTVSECSGTSDAHICSILGDQTTHFCTKVCTAPDDAGTDGGATENPCGDGATCTCDPRGCGCTPNACLN